MPLWIRVSITLWLAAGMCARHCASEPSDHWAFQSVKKPAIPPVPEPSRLKTPIDAFVLAKLDEHHWKPAPPASRADWIRRVYFDLIGLPPTPEEVEAFVHDSNVSAYERVVDRLLNSHHYGERWAQHWLDVVRFAETEGYEYDRHVPDAWRFRDYVIDSLNADKPFDQFIVEQIAGDEIDPDNTEYQVASIFHRLGPVRRNAGNPEIALSRNEVLTERTDVIGTAFLALTVGCARCHNHKLEPISQKDYYRLQSYLAATDEHNIVLASAADKAAWEGETKKVNDALQELKKVARLTTGPEKDRLDKELEALEEKLPPPLPTIPATWNNFDQRTPIHILRRGIWENKGDPVGPRPLSVLIGADVSELPPDVPVPRTHLARWLASPEHPLTARVMVNRIWQQHFGVGLVKTANDFGTHGEKPSHPELLDWLASTFLESGWRIKPIHRLIVLSATYRQQSSISEIGLRTSDSNPPSAIPNPQSLDPDNRLLWRFNRRRLSAEELRDSMLVVSGRLNRATGGPSVMLPVDPELVRQLYKPSQWQVPTRATEQDRRSVYLIAKRNLRLPFWEAFDAPALLTSCARRESSTHAPQALELMNGGLSNDLAAAFATRLRGESDNDPTRLVERAYWLAVGRAPTNSERELSVAFLGDQPLAEQTVREFALAIFNLNGFAYVP